MSTEQIVNRTAFGEHYERDKAELEGVLTAEGSRAQLIGRIELEPEIYPPPQPTFSMPPQSLEEEDAKAAATANELSPEEQIRTLAGTIGSLIQSSELESFKKQVVAAFKHLGLDTRKFFGV